MTACVDERRPAPDVYRQQRLRFLKDAIESGWEPGLDVIEKALDRLLERESLGRMMGDCDA